MDPNDPLFSIEYLEEINTLRASIDAIVVHIDHLKEIGAPSLDIGAYELERNGLIRRLDRLMGL